MQIVFYQDAGNFKDLMIKLTEKLDYSIAALTRKYAYTLVNALIDATPKDTGTAAANWQVGINTSPNEFLAQPKKGVPPRSPSDALNAAIRTIGGATVHDTIFITNNTPYIQRLNDGYSKQAPAGFIETAFLSVHTVISGGLDLEG